MFPIIKNLIKLLAALMLLGLSGTVVAGSCESDTATVSSSIGSTTSCSDNTVQGVPMSGCVIDSGGTSCTYDGFQCDFRVNVELGVGNSSDESTEYTVVNPGFGQPTCQTKIALTRGNQSSSFCRSDYPIGTNRDTMRTFGNNGNPVTHRQLEVCTDEQFVTVTPPVVSLERKVVRADLKDEFGTLLDPDCADATDDLPVIAPTKVTYCYTVTNNGVGLYEDLLVVDDNGTPDNEDDDLSSGPLDCDPDPDAQTCIRPSSSSDPAYPPPCDSSLAGGTSCALQSAIIEITNEGEQINTATVTGTFEGGTCTACGDSDTATINVVVACDASTQDEADATSAVVERRSLEGTTRCGPKPDNTVNTLAAGVGLLCDGTCDLKPNCVLPVNGSLPSHCAQPCKPSGNWNTLDNIGMAVVGIPSPDNLPLCQEVLTNPGNAAASLSTVTNPALVRSDGHSSGFRRNPFLYYFPASGGGNSVGTIYCILYDGESAADCPSGSIVY
jgi:hypothetical protein